MDYNSEVEKLKKLFEEGVLTQQEYENKKEALEKEKKASEAAVQKKSKNKKVITIVLIAVIAVVALLMVVTKVIIPNSKYNKALSLIDEGKYIESYELLDELNGYKDSDSKKLEIWPQVNMERMQSANIGDFVSFGSYPQSSSEDSEAIEWEVLDKKDNKVLLISRYVLDARPYNNPYQDKPEKLNWESSWLRGWLNGEFMDKAFDSFEQSHIDLTVVKGEISTDKKDPPGNDTSDKVFILNQEELKQYFPTYESMICEPTQYAILEGVADRTNDPGCFWTLRTYRSGSSNVPVVWPDGGWDAGFDDEFRAGIRPAIWVDTSL